MILAMSLGCLSFAGFNADRAFAESANRQYSLEGARYQLYTDEACTTEAMDANGNSAVLVTDAGGNSGSLNMNTGTYYAKEVAASTGYKLDTAVYTVTVTESNTEASPAAFTSNEPPVYGSPVFKVFKTSIGEGYEDYSKFIGAEFTVKYYDVADKAEISDLKIPYIANATAEVVEDTTNIRDLLQTQVSSSVMWEQTLLKMKDLGVDVFVEIGPGKTIAGFVKKTVPEIPVINVSTVEDIDAAVEKLAELAK